MDIINKVIAFIKTPKFWTWFAIITVADYLFFGRKLAVVPLIPYWYEFLTMIGLEKLKRSLSGGGGGGSRGSGQGAPPVGAPPKEEN